MLMTIEEQNKKKTESLFVLHQNPLSGCHTRDEKIILKVEFIDVCSKP